jgi:hypothetical protein
VTCYHGNAGLQHSASQVQVYKAAKYDGRILPQTHAMAYFASLLIANLIQSAGSILNVDWLIQWGTVYGPTCVVQGAFFVDPLGRGIPTGLQVLQRMSGMWEQLYGTVPFYLVHIHAYPCISMHFLMVHSFDFPHGQVSGMHP